MQSTTIGPEPVNLGNPQEITIRELADTVVEMTSSTSPIVYRPLPTDDPMRRRPDISRAALLLGWQPETALRSGLQRTIDYFLATLGPQGQRDRRRGAR